MAAIFNKTVFKPTVYLTDDTGPIVALFGGEYIIVFRRRRRR